MKTILLLIATLLGADDVQTKPYGEWTSPITSDTLVTQSVRLGEPRLDGDTLYWLESRPQEKGRTMLLAHEPGAAPREVLPPEVNVRSRVHEYGGGAYAVRNGAIVFVGFADQQLHLKRPGEAPRQVTADGPMRFADFHFATDTTGFAVREDHTNEHEPTNTIVHVDLTTGAQTVVAHGADFYSNPRVSPNGARVAWLQWNHPNMPWDGTELWIADIETNSIANARKIAGGNDESIFQPEWLDNGVLAFISDRTGWWNLYRWRDGATEALFPKDAEFGEPQWSFGQSTYAVLDADTLIASYSEDGKTHVGTLDLRSKSWQPIDLPHTNVSAIRANSGTLAYLGGSPTTDTELVRYDLATQQRTVVARASANVIDDAFVSIAQPIEFPTANDRTAHAFYYAPKNPDFAAPAGEKPPLLVLSHGGPTSAADDTLDPRILFWTSRGFAIVDVNYGGSTGYGRAYRERLRGQWGIVDVQDCVAAAQYLVQQGLADPDRLAIRGGSAGGYTTLAALAFTDVFKAGASYYGVADLEFLARDTHKFESRYLDSLIGPYPADKATYDARSPIHHLDSLNCPVIFFQGLDDRVVPPNQSQLMHDALKKKGVPTAYLPFENEGHGFRQAQNIKRAIEAELLFYAKIFNFTPADAIEPVTIANE